LSRRGASAASRQIVTAVGLFRGRFARRVRQVFLDFHLLPEAEKFTP
jgi:hypothetical protein